MEMIPSQHTTGPDYEQTVELNGRPYVIHMTWNSRVGYWFLSISDSLGGTIAGVKVVPNWPLLKNHRGQIVLDGELIVRPTKEGLDTIEYDGLGTDWYLLYMTPEEVMEWEDIVSGLG